MCLVDNVTTWINDNAIYFMRYKTSVSFMGPLYHVGMTIKYCPPIFEYKTSLAYFSKMPMILEYISQLVEIMNGYVTDQDIWSEDICHHSCVAYYAVSVVELIKCVF